jgi:hypothetical protein
VYVTVSDTHLDNIIRQRMSVIASSSLVSTCVTLNRLMCCTSCRTGLYMKITSGPRFLYNSESFGIMEEREEGERREVR